MVFLPGAHLDLYSSSTWVEWRGQTNTGGSAPVCNWKTETLELNATGLNCLGP